MPLPEEIPGKRNEVTGHTESSSESFKPADQYHQADQQNNSGHTATQDNSYKFIFDNSPLPSWIYRLNDYRILEVNQTAVSHYGYTKEEFLGMTILDLRPATEIRSLISVHEQSASKSGLIRFGIFTHRKKDGSLIQVDVSGTPIIYQGESCMIVACNDVSEKEAYQEEIRQSERKLRQATSIANLGYWNLQMDGQNLAWSDEVYRIWGRSREDFPLSYETFIVTIHPDDLQKFNEEQALSFKGQKAHDFEHRILLPDGSVRWVHERGRLRKDENGNPVVFEGTVQDITRQKEEELRLRLMESVILNTSESVLITEADPSGRNEQVIIYVNEAFTRITGYAAEEVKGKSPRFLQGPKTDTTALKKLSEAISNHLPCEINVINYKKNGEEFWHNFSVSPVADSSGSYAHWIAIGRDVTIQKYGELKKQLIADISRMFSIQGNLSDVMNMVMNHLMHSGNFQLAEAWLVNTDKTSLQLLSGQYAYGLSEYGNDSEIRRFKKGEGLPGIVWQNRATTIWGNLSHQENFIRRKILPASGGLSALALPIFYNEEVMGVLMFAGTESEQSLKSNAHLFEEFENFLGQKIKRKQLEDQLNEFFIYAPDLLCIAGPDGYFKKVNPAFTTLLGFSEQELISKPFSAFVHPDDYNKTLTELKEATSGHVTLSFENRMRTKNGEYRWISWSSSSLLTEEGLIFGYGKDITEQKKAAEVLAHERSLLRTLVDNIPDYIYVKDTFCRHLLNNIANVRLLGAENEESTIGTTVMDWFDRGLAEKFIEDDLSVLRSGQALVNKEEFVLMKSGEKRWLLTSKIPLLNPDGQPVGIVGISRDITEKKNLEELFHQATKMSLMGSWETDLHSNTLFWSDIVRQILEVDDQFIPDVESGIHFYKEGKSRNIIKKALEECIASGTPWDEEVQVVTAKGREKWVRVIGQAERRDNKTIRVYGSFQDIHQRKAAEMRLQNMADNIPGVMFQYTLYPDGRDSIQNLTRGAFDIWKYSAEECMKDINLIWNQIRNGGDFGKVQESISQSKISLERWYCQFRNLQPDGSLIWLEGTGTPQLMNDGSVMWDTLLTNITEKKELEQLVERASQLARIGSWEVDLRSPDPDAMYWSPMTREILEADPGYQPSLKGGMEWYEEKSRQLISSAIGKLIGTGEEFDLELLLTTAKGRQKWVRCIGQSERVSGRCIKIFGSFQDIHSKKILELQIREILGSISDAFYAVDREWRFLYFNKEAENLLKRTEVSMLGKSIWNEFPEVIGTDLETIYKRVAASGIPENFEYYYPGDHCWYEVNVYPSGGGLSAYFKNIDERRSAAEALRLAYEERNNILESIGDAFFAVDKNEQVTYWNKMAEKILGLNRSQVVGNNLWDVFPDAVNLEFFHQYRKATNTGETVSFEEYYPPTDMWLEVSAYPSEKGLSVYFKDISLRKLAEEKIRQSNERFEKVAEATNDAIWDWDIEQNTLYRGNGFKKLFGHEVEKVKTNLQTWTEKIHPEDLDDVLTSLHLAVLNPEKNNWQKEYRYLKADGSYAYVIDRGVLIRGINGVATRIVGAITDITYRKEFENSLRELNKKLDIRARELAASNNELEQFAYVASHDLQEPLRMITGFLTQLHKKYDHLLDDKGKQYIRFAVDGARRMRQIILDLLEFSRVGKANVKPEMVNTADLVEDVKQLLHNSIEENRAMIHSQNLPVIFYYRSQLLQVFNNLITNGIKYRRPDADPVVRISAEKREEEWLFSVSDNGIGIEKEYLEKIFIIFQRLHGSDHYSGTGIGLSIVKKIIESHGGKIWAESEPGKGSTFYFTIKAGK